MKREDLVRLLEPLARLPSGVRRALGAGVVLVPVGLYVGLRTSCVGATPPEAAPVVPAVAAEQILADAGAELAPVEPVKTTATLQFTVTPNTAQATVSWGKKRLGIIKPHYPLIVTRPRDSGPLDVVVTAQGFLPVQTRAYTFNDSKILVKLTKPEESNTLLGYRVPIEAGIPLTVDMADGGTPSAPAVSVTPVEAPAAPAVP
jgi:hypothetical protein